MKTYIVIFEKSTTRKNPLGSGGKAEIDAENKSEIRSFCRNVYPKEKIKSITEK